MRRRKCSSASVEDAAAETTAAGFVARLPDPVGLGVVDDEAGAGLGRSALVRVADDLQRRKAVSASLKPITLKVNTYAALRRWIAIILSAKSIGDRSFSFPLDEGLTGLVEGSIQRERVGECVKDPLI